MIEVVNLFLRNFHFLVSYCAEFYGKSASYTVDTYPSDCRLCRTLFQTVYIDRCNKYMKSLSTASPCTQGMTAALSVTISGNENHEEQCFGLFEEKVI